MTREDVIKGLKEIVRDKGMWRKKAYYAIVCKNALDMIEGGSEESLHEDPGETYARLPSDTEEYVNPIAMVARTECRRCGKRIAKNAYGICEECSEELKGVIGKVWHGDPV